MVVGTEHKGHYVAPGYPMRVLESVLDAYRPDLVLVEIRPEAFAQGQYEDGPIEMSYVTLAAAKRHVAVAGIDWWREEDFGKDAPTLDAEGDREFERSYADAARRVDSYDTFAVLNSPERARDVLAFRNAQTRLGSGEGALWERRQAWFNHRAETAIAERHATRTLAFVGFAHRPELEAHLVLRGMTSTDPRALGAKLDDGPVPDDVIDFWKQAVERMKAKAAATSNPALKQSFERKIASWEAAVARRGQCCVAQ
jgi:hypothetical protein